jgi:DNA ligase D-like protein (predicted ligase)
MKKSSFKLSPELEKLIKREKQPDWISPMLAILTDEYFSDPNWIYEKKFDGWRAIAYKHGSKVKLLSRNKMSLNEMYPDIVNALLKEKATSFIIDGEIAIAQKKGKSFELMQERRKEITLGEISASQIPMVYNVFDLLYIDEYLITKLPLLDRKKILKKYLSFKKPISFTKHTKETGLKFYHQACKKGWEGVIAKRADSPYVSKRSKDWLKFKCIHEQEFVIGGYTDPQGSRTGFGALLIGYYEGKEFKYAGKVGTGYDEELLESLGAKLKKLERKKCPFASDEDLPKKNVHWVHPKIVAQIEFMEWTQYGKLRHPSFLYLRTDKKPKDVIKEKPKKVK